MKTKTSSGSRRRPAKLWQLRLYVTGQTPKSLAAGRLLLAGQRLGFFTRGLRHTRRAGQDATGTDVSVHQVNAPVRNQELADLIRVRHAARLQHIEHAVALAVALEVLQQNPGVHG